MILRQLLPLSLAGKFAGVLWCELPTLSLCLCLCTVWFASVCGVRICGGCSCCSETCVHATPVLSLSLSLSLSVLLARSFSLAHALSFSFTLVCFSLVAFGEGDDGDHGDGDLKRGAGTHQPCSIIDRALYWPEAHFVMDRPCSCLHSSAFVDQDVV